ncbi:hypothetical protein AVEN_3015-1 [Araneus ventricosus]|uniref:Uncharacterized protein n=1 Tax=Araneus ventricosus TaxID=182803 RepID=A0A4Y2IIF3_ARAVE|nr:hypothetical protein AVEN_3015-1 [Araneus ventricosus]
MPIKIPAPRFATELRSSRDILIKFQPDSPDLNTIMSFSQNNFFTNEPIWNKGNGTNQMERQEQSSQISKARWEGGKNQFRMSSTSNNQSRALNSANCYD